MQLKHLEFKIRKGLELDPNASTDAPLVGFGVGCLALMGHISFAITGNFPLTTTLLAAFAPIAPYLFKVGYCLYTDFQLDQDPTLSTLGSQLLIAYPNLLEEFKNEGTLAELDFIQNIEELFKKKSLFLIKPLLFKAEKNLKELYQFKKNVPIADERGIENKYTVILPAFSAMNDERSLGALLEKKAETSVSEITPPRVHFPTP